MRLFNPRMRMVAPIAGLALLVACNSDMTRSLKLPDVGSAMRLTPENDRNIIKISPDATIPILLASNKQETVFTVNGVSPSPAKMLKLLVPKSRLRIEAQAPCYRTLVQTAEPDGFSSSSLFQFTFANWDRQPGGRSANCE